MSQIKNTRPVDARRAIMTAKQERRYMDTFRDKPCEACGISDGSIVPAHFNMGLGGTGYRARGHVVGLCNRPGGCHDLIDRRVIDEKARTAVLEKLIQKLLRDRARAYSSLKATGEDNGS